MTSTTATQQGPRSTHQADPWALKKHLLCQHLLDHQKSKRVRDKQSQSLWLCGSQQTGKFFKRWEYQTTWLASWEICMQVRKQQLELDMEQQTGSKLGKEYIKAVYCHPAYLTYMQSTSWEILGWRKHKLESRFPGEILTTLVMQMTPPYGRKWRRTKEPLDESERREWKSWLKAHHLEN